MEPVRDRLRGINNPGCGAAQGTVRAQLTRIYAKAGVSGRAQFAAFFVEDLLAGAVGKV